MRIMPFAVLAGLVATGCSSTIHAPLGYAGGAPVTYLAADVSGAVCYNRIIGAQAVDSICEDDATLRYSPHRVYVGEAAYRIDDAEMPAYVLALFSTMHAPEDGHPVMPGPFERNSTHIRSAKSM